MTTPSVHIEPGRALVTLAMVMTAAVATSAGCPPAATCATSADCPVQQLCVEHGCRTRCAVTADCGPGLTCISGACLPVGQACANPADCLATETCSEGVCRWLCARDRDCFDGARCSGGVCRPETSDGGSLDRVASDAIARDTRGRDVPISTTLQATGVLVPTAGPIQNASYRARGMLVSPPGASSATSQHFRVRSPFVTTRDP